MIDIKKVDILTSKLEKYYNSENKEVDKVKTLEELNKEITKILSDIDYYENKLETCKSKLNSRDRKLLNEIKRNQKKLDEVIESLDNLEGLELVKVEKSIVYLNEKNNKIIKNHSKIYEIFNLEIEIIKNKELYELYNFYVKKIEETADK